MTHYGGQASDGQRAMHLQKKREREQEELELRKRKLEDTLKVPKLFLEVFFCFHELDEQIYRNDKSYFGH